jgi:hypothetical protein
MGGAGTGGGGTGGSKTGGGGRNYISMLLVNVCHLKEQSNIQLQQAKKVEVAGPLQEQQEWEVQEQEVQEQEGQKQEEEGATSMCC